MNSTEKVLLNVLRMDSQSAGFTLRVWKKIALAAVNLLEPSLVVPVRQLTVRHNSIVVLMLYVSLRNRPCTLMLPH